MNLEGIYGDGIHDDTAGIQSLLDSGKSCVYLPAPADHYLISAPLRLNSNQELRLDRFTRVRLAPKSNCFMVTNSDKEQGNHHIALTGGIWDFDNRNQGPNFAFQHMVDPSLPEVKPGTPYNPALYRGVAMYFENVTNFVVNGITIRNPVTYAFQMCRASYFVINDVEFDFSSWNPYKANMDGVHLDGFCHHGKISNLRGTCYDDMIALNANDGRCAAFQGEISDIDIDGVYCEYCHSAVRMLSTGANLKRVTIRNVHGNFYRYAIGLTHFFPDRATRGVFEDIVIEDCFVGAAEQPTVDLFWKLLPMPVIFCDEHIDVGTLTIRNLFREESRIAPPTILVQKECHIRRLIIRDCRQENQLNEPLTFMENHGNVEALTLDNIALEGNDSVLVSTCGESCSRR